MRPPAPVALGDGLVKICGLRRTEHAVAAAEVGADLLGFVFAESKRQVTPEEAAVCVAAARRAADRPVLAVGVFVDASDDELDRAVEVAGLDLVQLHGRTTASCSTDSAWPVIRALRVEPGATTADVVGRMRREGEMGVPPVAWFIDGYHPVAHGGTGARADWAVAAAIAVRVPLMLAGGLTPENVPEAIRRVRPIGVDVSSGVERAGEKDPALIRAFVRAAQQAFAAP